MFTDPQSVTINAIANSLPRIDTGDRSAVYLKDDETLTLTVSHLDTRNGRTRRMVRLDQTKIAADPFISGNNREVAAATFVVVDEPDDGSFTNTELLNLEKGLIGWLTDANVTKVLAGES